MTKEFWMGIAIGGFLMFFSCLTVGMLAETYLPK